MISIDLTETAHFVYWKSETTCETNFFLTFIFSDKKNFFLELNFVLDWILSQTEFCLGLHTTVVFRMQSFNFFIDLKLTHYDKKFLIKIACVEKQYFQWKKKP